MSLSPFSGEFCGVTVSKRQELERECFFCCLYTVEWKNIRIFIRFRIPNVEFTVFVRVRIVSVLSMYAGF